MAIKMKKLSEYEKKVYKHLKSNYHITDTMYKFIIEYAIKPLNDTGVKICGDGWTVEKDKIWLDLVKLNLKEAYHFRGIGVKIFIDMLICLNLPILCKETISFILYEYVRNGMEGSTVMNFSVFCTHCEKVLEDIRKEKSIFLPDVDRNSILNGVDNKSVLLLDKQYKVTTISDKVEFITTIQAYNTEKFLYNFLVKVGKTKYDRITDELVEQAIKHSGRTPNVKQKQFLEDFKNKGVGILTGLGGTGKSFTTKTVLDILDLAGYKYECVSPTGISAKVFMESTGRKCETIHKKFFSQDNSLLDTTDVLVLEESGMYGLDHFVMIKTMIDNMDTRYYLQNEEHKDLKLLFIGDVNQLQPISSGCFFRDIIDLAKVGVFECSYMFLDEIMRAKSELYIPHLCKMFCVDENKIPSTVYDNEESSVYMIPLDASVEESEDIATFIYDYMKACEFNFFNTTVIIPQRVGSKGTTIINELIDNLYMNDKNNKNPKRIGMITQNNYPKGVVNGDKFTIEEQYKVEIETANGYSKTVDYYRVKMFDDGREIKFVDKELKWELAYASTVHKLQGATIENVIFLCSKTHTYMLTKQLVYTALSRASKTLTVLYDKYTFEKSRGKNTIYNRLTFLGKIYKNKLDKLK